MRKQVMMAKRQTFVVAAVLAAMSLVAIVFSQGGKSQSGQKPLPPIQQKNMNEKELVIAGGCFWCVEAIFEDLKGVSSVESGYTGSDFQNPTYEQVCSGRTGHAEAVKITYDPKIVSPDDLLRIFFVTHDPTQLNRQGPDSGTQYRSAIFVSTPEEKALAEKIIREIATERLYPGKIVTTIEKLGVWYPAEDYHQDYFDKYEKASTAEKMKMNAGYCNAVVAPKVNKFRAKYAAKLRKN